MILYFMIFKDLLATNILIFIQSLARIIQKEQKTNYFSSLLATKEGKEGQILTEKCSLWP